MEISSRTSDTNKAWRSKSYHVSDGSKRRNMKTARFGESSLLLPTRLWAKLKNVYPGKKQNVVGGENESRGKQALKVHNASMGYANEEFNNRLIFEIYKNVISSQELAPTI